MWQTTIDLVGLIKVLTGNFRDLPVPIGSSDILVGEQLRPRQIRAIWVDRPRSKFDLPRLLITADGELRELLAWTATYADGIHPITSLCRVMEWSMFVHTSATAAPDDIRHFELALGGMAIAEALTHGRGRVTLSSLTIPACESTYSFCKARSLAIGLGRDYRHELGQRWLGARSIASQPERIPHPGDIDWLWDVVAALLSNSHDTVAPIGSIVSACQQLQKAGSVSRDLLGKLTKGSFDVERVLAAMSGTREERVGAFEVALRTVAEQKLAHSVDGDFLCGYLASRLNPGSFEYVALVCQYLEHQPMILMWYALCESLVPESKMLFRHEGVLRRVLREIMQPESIFSVPRCDVALDELSILSLDRGAFESLRAGLQTPIRVEILPLVYTRLRSTQSGGEQMALFKTAESTNVARFAKQIGSAIETLERVYSKLAGDPVRANEPSRKPQKRSKKDGGIKGD